jgi:hypothetical protein
LEPSPVLPVQSENLDRGPLVAVHLRVDAFARTRSEEPRWIDALTVERRVDELVRAGAAACAQGRSVTIVHGARDQVIACGPLRAALQFLLRMKERMRLTLGEDAILTAGVSVAYRGRNEPDVARLIRDAKARLAEADGAGGGRIVLLGAIVPTHEMDVVFTLGDELAELAGAAPGPVFALLEAALRIGTGGEDLPLSAVERLRGAIHEVAGRLGIHAQDLRVRSESDAAPLRALKTLLANIGMFDTGVARAPLSYAVLLSEAREAHSVSEARP